MTVCLIVPFPSASRIGYIRKLAGMMACCSARGGEQSLAVQLRAQQQAMLRRGLAPEVVDRELRSLELAVRARLWSIVMQGGDAA
jgi:hypothetical protein